MRCSISIGERIIIESSRGRRRTADDSAEYVAEHDEPLDDLLFRPNFTVDKYQSIRQRSRTKTPLLSSLFTPSPCPVILLCRYKQRADECSPSSHPRHQSPTSQRSVFNQMDHRRTTKRQRYRFVLPLREKTNLTASFSLAEKSYRTTDSMDKSVSPSNMLSLALSSSSSRLSMPFVLILLLVSLR